MSLLRIARGLWLIGGFAFLLAALRPAALRPQPLAPAGNTTPASWCFGDFCEGAVYPTTRIDRLPPRLPTQGSWLPSGHRPASTQTVWFAPVSGHVDVFVAGYPHAPGCALRVDFRSAAGQITTVEFDQPNPAETWTQWEVPVPAGAAALRYRAQGGVDGSPYWLGFSRPVSSPPLLSIVGYQAAQIVATLALGLVLLWLPGIAARRRSPAPEIQTVLMLGTGPLLLAGISLVAWLLGQWISPLTSAALGAGLLWAYGGLRLWREPSAFQVSPALARILAIAALCAVAALAKSADSGGPEGELFRGEARRTLAVGNRTDSETSFRVVQVVAQHLSPFAADTFAYFAPWSFFSRGPLAGLIAAPVVFATGKPPAGRINATWQPFDPWGYTSYRIVMGILATFSLVGLFLVLTQFVTERSALIGAAAMALSPFVLHETFFTWPKLAATAGLLVSFLLAHRSRPLLAGVTLAAAYLLHPLALLWTPWLGLWALARGPRTLPAVLSRGTAFAAPVVVTAGVWMAAGEIVQKASGTFFAAQSAFLSYFTWADGFPAPFSHWLVSRWQNAANTFLPFYLHFFHEQHSDLNSIYGPAGPLVKFSFSWWNTLPLGMGLLLWVIVILALIQAWRVYSAAIGLFILGPAVLLCLYWGDKSTGLMRECGHPLIPAVIALAVIGLERTPNRLARIFSHRAFPWIQLPEVLLMFWLTTLANPHPPATDLNLLDPLWLALNVAALAASAALARQAKATPSPAR